MNRLPGAMDQGPRYAIYFVPPADSPLYRFGSAVLGYDSRAASGVPRPAEAAGEAAIWECLTAEPRRYGFHATLKAPFHLSPSCREAQLVSAVESFAGLGHAIPQFTPELRLLGGFAAVVSQQPIRAIDELAANCTTLFDAFRAPMSAQERARRVASGLNRNQIENLDRWGYPYLFDDFRFHMTLTGRLEATLYEYALATLQTVFARLGADADIAVDRLTLLKQEGANAPFRVIAEAPLRKPG